MSISNKTLYKLEIKSTKYFPIGIALLYLCNIILSFNDYNLEIFSIIGGMSLLPLGKLYLDSLTFKLCFHHRIFIYYIFLCNLISSIDVYTNYELFNERDLFILYLILFGVALILYIIFKRRYDFSRKYSSKIP